MVTRRRQRNGAAMPASGGDRFPALQTATPGAGIGRSDPFAKTVSELIEKPPLRFQKGSGPVIDPIKLIHLSRASEKCCNQMA